MSFITHDVNGQAPLTLSSKKNVQSAIAYVFEACHTNEYGFVGGAGPALVEKAVKQGFAFCLIS